MGLPNIITQRNKVNIWTFTQNIFQAFFRLFMQLRLFQIIQQKENAMSSSSPLFRVGVYIPAPHSVAPDSGGVTR